MIVAINNATMSQQRCDERAKKDRRTEFRGIKIVWSFFLNSYEIITSPVFPILRRIFTRAWADMFIPEEWQKDIIIPLYYKGKGSRGEQQ